MSLKCFNQLKLYAFETPFMNALIVFHRYLFNQLTNLCCFAKCRFIYSLQKCRISAAFISCFYFIFLHVLYVQTKRHWNSFTTDFLVDIEIVEESLNNLLMAESNETLAAKMGSREDREEILKSPIRCHHIGCSKQFKNMPQLKHHLISFHN